MKILQVHIKLIATFSISVTHGHSLCAFIPLVFLFMVFSILELWCLDSMLVVHLPSLHSALRNYVASIS